MHDHQQEQDFYRCLVADASSRALQNIRDILADDTLPQPHPLTAAERLERCVYRRQTGAVRAVWSQGRKVYTAE